jgi:hypothetical protein
MTRRDAYTLGVVAVLGLAAAFWFMMLSPKRSELSKLETQVTESEAALQAARGEAQQFAQGRQDFPTNYTTVSRLGKAVPADPDIPSLVVQLDRAANEAGVDFRKLTSESGGSESAATPPAPAPAAPSGDAAAGATGASGAAEGATGAAGATGGEAAGGTGATGAATGAPAPADAILTPTTPLGVDVGPAGLSVSKFNFEFQGNFFRMADLIHNVRSLVQRRNRQLVISGRLITIGGISMSKGDKGFPNVGVTMSAQSYLLPPSQGLFAGATAAGPANATATTPTPPAAAAPSAPPAAVVSPR